MRRFVWMISLAMMMAMIGGCGDDLIDPNDPNALSAVLTIPGAVRVSGQPPTSSGGSNAPSINGGSNLNINSGGQAVIEVSYQSISGYNNCIVQVEGADEYFDVPTSEPANEGTIQIPVNVPEEVDTGSFSLYTCILDGNGSVSNAVSTTVGVTNLASQEDEDDGGDGVYCSGQQITSSCTLEFCISAAGDSCYYEVDGRRINCPGCQTSSCVQQAANACLD